MIAAYADCNISKEILHWALIIIVLDYCAVIRIKFCIATEPIALLARRSALLECYGNNIIIY